MTARDENVNEAGKEAASTASASKAPCYDTAEFLKLLFQPGDVWEVRAPKCLIFKDASATATASGYFNDPWKAAKQAKILDQYRQPRGVYVTINPVEPVLLARTNNKIDDQAKSTTADRQILRRRWLFIDIDPVRPADVSSTSEEMGAALALSKKIRSELKEAGWPEPISGMSGNGAFLLYRVDLPNDRQSTELVRRCCTAWLSGSIARQPRSTPRRTMPPAS